MKSKTKAVGGTPTSPAAQQYTNFLMGGMQNGMFGMPFQPATTGGDWLQNAFGKMFPQLAGQSGTSATNNPMSSTMGYAGALNQLLGGQALGDPKSLMDMFNQMGQQGGIGNMPNITSGFQAPAFNQFNLQSPVLSNQQFNPLQFQQAPLANVLGQMPAFQQTQLQQAPLAAGQYINPGWQNPNINSNIQTSAAGLDPSSPYAKALQDILARQETQNIAGLRERFTGTSGTMGTPAAFAEALFRAEAAPREIAAMTQADQAVRGLNLQEMGLANQARGDLNSLMGQLGLAQNQFNQQGAQFGSQFGLQQAGLNADIINQLNQMQLQQGLAGNQYGLQAGQLGLQQAGLNADIVNQMNQLMNNQNQFGANFGLQQTGLNADIMNQLNQLGLNQSLAGNQFNQQNAMFGASQDMNAQMQNIANMLQNQQMMNQYGMGMGGLYQGFAGQNLQGMLGALGPLMGQYSQLMGMGTPQAQMVQQPSAFSQITGALGNVLNPLSMISQATGWNPFGGLFGGGGGMPMTSPNIQTPNWNPTINWGFQPNIGSA